MVSVEAAGKSAEVLVEVEVQAVVWVEVLAVVWVEAAGWYSAEAAVDSGQSEP